MEFLYDRKTTVIGQDTLKMELIETGDVAKIEDNGFKINYMIGNTINGGDGNLYLRVFENGEIFYTEMTGVLSPAKFCVEADRAFYKGTFKEVDYVVELATVDNKWFYTVTLTGEEKEVDVVYGQSLYGDFYSAQYVDFVSTTCETGFAICSRGTMTKEYVQMGTLTKNVGYVTDGFQFFGLQYKEDGIIEALTKENLPNEKYQYEYSFIGLQSERMTLAGEGKAIFYGLHVGGYDKAIEEAVRLSDVQTSFEKLVPIAYDETKLQKVELKIHMDKLLKTEDFTQEELDARYPEKRFVESKDGKCHAFFTPTYEHVVTKAKELVVERVHGNIIYNKEVDFANPVIASTNYMYGVFNSHIVVGNTNINKFTSDTRNYLNVLKTSGQRILVKLEGVYQLLAMPSLYELGVNYSKWFYKIKNDTIMVTAYTTDATPEIVTEVVSEKGLAYDFIILNELTMGEQERENKIILTEVENGIECTPENGAFMHQKYPHIKYTCLLDKPFEVVNDSVFFEDGMHRKEPYLIFKVDGQAALRFEVLGQRDVECVVPSQISFEEAKEGYRLHYQNLLNGFHVELDGKQEEIEKYNAIALWYTHNALIHYITPHGLEQSGGAAWGTRDVCQGPMEYFLATQNTASARKILLEIFRHQYIENGGWPQWFMFDKYVNIQHPHSHGDIIVWPLRTVAIYLQATGDYSILEEKVVYTSVKDFTYTKEYTLLDHIKKETEYIEKNYIKGTHLSVYAGGDWNDSMVPTSKELCNNMVSGWTTMLTYEAYKYLATELAHIDVEFSKYLAKTSEKIKADIEKHVIIDEIPAGFLLFKEGSFIPIIHPSDQQTGIRYRLLPINRGIISELYSKEQAEKLTNIAMENLYREDGAMLFSDPIKYNGGETTYFQRSEQASNVGREIGLFYVHAHLRFIEAMARANKAEEAWMSLDKVNPILIEKSVKNAVYRQTNTYFSSSDADVCNRYEYEEKFEAVKRGEVGVKGGWRIYSSGPAIYLNQLITNCLGVKLNKGNLEVSPTLPSKYDGLKFTYHYQDKAITFIYHVAGNKNISKVSVNGEKATTQLGENTYGKQSVVLPKEYLLDKLIAKTNVIEIWV